MRRLVLSILAAIATVLILWAGIAVSTGNYPVLSHLFPGFHPVGTYPVLTHLFGARHPG